MSRREDEIRLLQVDITEQEYLVRSAELAKELVNKMEMEADHKDQKKDMKAAEDKLSLRIKELTDIVHSKREPRNIQCYWMPVYRERKWQLIRTDTGEIVEEVTMSKTELQGEFKFGESNVVTHSRWFTRTEESTDAAGAGAAGGELGEKQLEPIDAESEADSADESQHTESADESETELPKITN